MERERLEKDRLERERSETGMIEQESLRMLETGRERNSIDRDREDNIRSRSVDNIIREIGNRRERMGRDRSERERLEEERSERHISERERLERERLEIERFGREARMNRKYCRPND